VGRVAHGVSRRVDRLKGLGNAIVPQIAEQIALTIKQVG
jgi:DNA (cytosine-5)-methyltransferase 1